MNSDFEDFMQEVENKCSFLYENGYSFQTFTKQYLNRIENEIVSDKVYVQHKNNNLDGLDKVFISCKNIINLELSSTDTLYLLDRYIKDKLRNYHSKAEVEIYYLPALKKIFNLPEFSNLERKKASKHLKELLNLDENISRSTYIIFKK